MKTILPYAVKTKLNDFILDKFREREKRNGTAKIKDIEQELADYCGISINGIRQIRREFCTPSIEVATKMAEFFNVPVETMFELVDKNK